MQKPRQGISKPCKEEKPDTKGSVLDGFIYGRPSKGKRLRGGKQTSGGCRVGGPGERSGELQGGRKGVSNTHALPAKGQQQIFLSLWANASFVFFIPLRGFKRKPGWAPGLAHGLQSVILM